MTTEASPSSSTGKGERPRFPDLFIASSYHHALSLRRAFGLGPTGYSRLAQVHVTYPGASICALRFHNVVIGRETLLRMNEPRLHEWFRDHIESRMVGELIDM